MDMAGYLAGARGRFLEFGGFAEVEEERVPPAVAHWADCLLIREDPGLITLVAAIQAVGDAPVHSLHAGLLQAARQVAAERRTDVLAVLLVVYETPLTRAVYDQVQRLKVADKGVRLVPWLVDLSRGQLFQHEGPPFGVDPDLITLAAPEHPTTRHVDEPRRGGGPAGAWAVARRFPVTSALMAVNIAVFVAMVVAGGGLSGATANEVLTTFGAVVRPELWQTGQYWRLFTAAFVHIGAAHLLVNAISLWSVGQLVEAMFGRWRMLYIYGVAAVAGSALSCMLGAPIVTSAGASGAIFGLLGAVVWFRLSSPLGHRISWRPLILTLLLNLGIGVALRSFIDNWNHVGGLVGGTLAAAAVGVPLVAGAARPRLLGPRPVHTGLVALLLAGALALVTGLVDVPGPGRDLAEGKALLSQRQYAAALPRFERAARTQPDEPTLWFNLTQVYLQLDRCADARQSLKQLVATAQPDPLIDRLSSQVGLCTRP